MPIGAENGVFSMGYRDEDPTDRSNQESGDTREWYVVDYTDERGNYVELVDDVDLRELESSVITVNEVKGITEEQYYTLKESSSLTALLDILAVPSDK